LFFSVIEIKLKLNKIYKYQTKKISNVATEIILNQCTKMTKTGVKIQEMEVK